jgi:hypothetical protein
MVAVIVEPVDQVVGVLEGLTTRHRLTANLNRYKNDRELLQKVEEWS